MDEPRTTVQRVADTLHRLETEADCWVASAGPDGVPSLVPLSFAWDGQHLHLATRYTHPVAKNAQATGRLKIAIGATRDVVLIDAEARIVPLDAVDASIAELFERRAGYDAREPDGFLFLEVTPKTIRAWREVNEIEGRTIMRNGSWIDTPRDATRAPRTRGRNEQIGR